MADLKKNNGRLKILTTLGSLISIGFGTWHFFVPSIWDWYAYFDKEAKELVLAVQAINIFFSLLLILLGAGNLLLVFRKVQDYYSLAIVLSISAIVWATRIALQILYPQGTQIPIIQYSMLVTFVIVFVCFMVALLHILHQPKS